MGLSYSGLLVRFLVRGKEGNRKETGERKEIGHDCFDRSILTPCVVGNCNVGSRGSNWS